MIKIIGCLLIFGACTLGGFIYAENYKKRVNELHELERAIYQLQSEILFTYSPLSEAFTHVSQKSKQPIRDLFMKISEHLHLSTVESTFEAFYMTLQEKQNMLHISEEDKGILLDLAKTLGESDIEGQRNLFQMVMGNLKKQIEQAEVSMLKNVKMYRYLGFSLGATIIIILV